MGEDIHNKAYAKSKATGKYIQSSEMVVDQSFSYSAFQDLISIRSYRLFSCFGSHRADFKQLECLHEGIPDFVKEQFPVEYANLADKDWNFYGFCWTTIKELEESIKKYIEKLKDPMLYYDSDEDEYEREVFEDIEENKESRDAWKEEAEMVSSQLHDILKRIESMREVAEHTEAGKLIDFDSTIYMFWFDS